MDKRWIYDLTGALTLFSLLLLIGACSGQRGQSFDDLPTVASFESIQQQATADFLTQNAPPLGFREVVSYPQVDDGLEQLAGWRYLVTLEFNGVFARTPRETSATARAEVWFNQLGSARRLVVETAGELIGQTEDQDFEAVRLGPDSFLIRDGLCLTGDAAAVAANLRAGELVGGVNNATPTGRRATINGQEVWEYAFFPDDLNLPAIRLAEDGQVIGRGELWVAPARNSVIRFYVNLDVTNAFIFDRALPVTGQVLLRYDLYDIGVQPNISVPFGC